MAITINLGEDFQRKKTFSEILCIVDEFIRADFLKYGGSTDKALLKKGLEPPHLYSCYYSDSPTLSHSFTIEYKDHSLIRQLKEDVYGLGAEALLKAFDRPASGMVITIDGRETVSLNQNVRSESGDNGLSTFPIRQDDFLKLCNANHLKFEVFKGGESIISFFENEKDEILMIEHCRALYNYVVDDSMFPDALPNLLRWRKTGRIGTSTAAQRFEDVESVKNSRKTKIGILIAIVLIFLLIFVL
ncbi:MAG: hypothetical protein II975_05325 [Bacteroidales bacterium]|nr:hypothetical protein [Bacteroidales bacterium]